MPLHRILKNKKKLEILNLMIKMIRHLAKIIKIIKIHQRYFLS